MSKTGSKKVISLVDKLRENRLGLLKYILRKQKTKVVRLIKGMYAEEKMGKGRLKKLKGM